MSVLSEKDRLALTQHTMTLLDDWGLQPQEIMAVLDLPESTKPRHISRFRHDTPFPDEPQIFRRVEYLFKIAEALRTSYPFSQQMRSRWLRNANHRMGGKAPLRMMLDGGEDGLVWVLARLDCTFAWDSTGSKG